MIATGSLGSGSNMQVPSQAGGGGISLTPSLHETNIRYVRALYDFEASRGDEMDLQRGAVYRVVADRGQWLLGENDTLTCRGEFPGTYVERGAASVIMIVMRPPFHLKHPCSAINTTLLT